MPYGYPEFPRAKLLDTDYAELIRYYKEVKDKYDGTLNSITELSMRLTAYENDVTNKINNIQQVVVPNAVNVAVSSAMTQYQQGIDGSIIELRRQITSLDSEIKSTENLISKVQSDTIKAVSAVEEQLEMNVQHLSVQIQNLNSQMNLLVSQTDGRIENFESYVHSKLDEFDKKIVDFSEDVLEEFSEMLSQDIAEVNIIIRREVANIRSDMIAQEMLNKAYTDRKIADIKTLIDTIEIESSLKAVTWIWKYGCNFGGYNAMQWYDDVSITAEDWNKSNVTGVDWYVRGREVFNWFYRRTFMFSPISGNWMSERDVIREMCRYMQINGVTAKQYDDIRLTAGEYDAGRLMAQQYDYAGKEYLYALKGNE